LLGFGWDNSAFLLGEEWVFRFPRRQLAANLIENECRILPLVAPHLPLAVPVPEFVGRASEVFPWTFAGYRHIEGTPASEANKRPLSKTVMPQALSGFLTALHEFELPVGVELPSDEIRRSDLSFRLGKFLSLIRKQCDPIGSNLGNRLGDLAMRLVKEAKPASKLCLVHGDLYPGHVLINASGLPVAVIDWGDVHLGDPALDLAVAYNMLNRSAREAFFWKYGADEHARRRAKFKALYYGAVFFDQGQTESRPDLIGLARRCFAACTEDDGICPLPIPSEPTPRPPSARR
jgi:aminoglycoside phosphotransferase (APT) family kinase protein